jgi:hypothetical protein
MKIIEIRCPFCGTIKKMNQTKLSAYYNKTIEVACGNSTCKKPIGIKVDANLFNQEKGKQNAQGNPQQRRFQTELIDEDTPISSTELLQLNVMRNEWTATQTIQLSEGENIIGRNTNSTSPNKREVMTSDKIMSRNHFKITIEKSEDTYYFFLKDVGSANGTKLDDQLIGDNEVQLQKNQRITAGKTSFLLK